MRRFVNVTSVRKGEISGVRGVFKSNNCQRGSRLEVRSSKCERRVCALAVDKGLARDTAEGKADDC